MPLKYFPHGKKREQFRKSGILTMTKTVRKIVVVILGLALLAVGVPLYHPADANHDDRIGLEDTILQVRSLSRTAENPSLFAERLEKTLLAFQMTAGLKKSFRAARDKQAQTFFNLDQPFLLADAVGWLLPAQKWIPLEKAIHYLSVDLTPKTPPPEPRFC